MRKASNLIEAFCNGELNAGDFGHREHVEVAWEMLRKFAFLEACNHYCLGIERLATAAGVPDKFNLTITLAFMSLIAEKMGTDPGNDFEQFYRNHPELRDRPLDNWYSPDRLADKRSRKVFLMPDRVTNGRTETPLI